MNRAVFLDLDGTLVRAFPEGNTTRGPRTIDEIEILDETTESIERLEKAYYPCFVVSNQPDISRGIIVHRHYTCVVAAISKLIGIPMNRFGICPHDSDDDCVCRKPRPGLFYVAAYGYDLSLSKCWMIGDREHDREAAIRAGIPQSQAIKIETNQSIKDAVDFILAQQKVA